MECAGKRRGTRCLGPATRRCARCGAVAYCSLSHQISHWGVHKAECGRFEQQMERMDVLNDFPFEFSQEATVEVCEKRETRCSFLSRRGIHRVGIWKYECCCEASFTSLDDSRGDGSWNLPRYMCPCTAPGCHVSKLSNWKDYYEWRGLPRGSPAALLLHWPLTVYYATQISGMDCLASGGRSELCIHYLGPEKELLQLATFRELLAFFPGVDVHIEFIGPAVPKDRDGEMIRLCRFARCSEVGCICKSTSDNVNYGNNNGRTSAVTIYLRRGFYHEHYRDITEEAFPHLVIALNAGIAAYPSWLPTIEILKQMNVPIVFSDYCEEACNVAAQCISSVTDKPLSLPIQLNPFRQPIAVEDSALLLPCYSNCFLFGI